MNSCDNIFYVNVQNFHAQGLMVIQDMLQVFIVRLSCQRMQGATVLLDPIFSWLNDIANRTTLLDMEAFKVHGANRSN
jgi:hypothetical protein